MAKGYIEFDNLVQADSDVAGKSQQFRYVGAATTAAPGQ